jgi:hypothetical protein
MKRRDILRSIAVTPLLGRFALPASAESNAATLYREAVAKLPALSDADKELLKNVAETRLDASAKGLVHRSAPALDLLRQAAKAPRCDWGDVWSGDGFHQLMDFWSGALRLSQISTLCARFAFQDRQMPVGVDDFVAMMTLGRHLGQIGALMCPIVGRHIEYKAIEAVAVALPGLDRSTIALLLDRFNVLPKEVSLRAIIEGERSFLLRYYIPHNKAEYDDAKIKEVIAWYDRLSLACDDHASLATLRDASKGNVEQIKFLDNVDNLRLNAIPYANVKRALFRAAIAVVEDGPKAIGRVVDPFDGKPFDLKTWTTGFELTSRFALEGKPKASLVVGHR